MFSYRGFCRVLHHGWRILNPDRANKHLQAAVNNLPVVCSNQKLVGLIPAALQCLYVY